MVVIFCFGLAKSSVNLAGLCQTAQPFFVLISVDITEAEHIVDDDEITVELHDEVSFQFAVLVKCLLIAAKSISSLFHISVQFP
jgi:hypothetical protein